MTDRPIEHEGVLADANLVASRVDGGRIQDNILFFARLLRAAGLPIGPQKTVLATQAVLAAGIESPNVLYWTLHSCLVTQPSQHEIFDQAFHVFWRDPGYLEKMLSLILPKAPGSAEPQNERELSRRLREQLLGTRRTEDLGDESLIEADGRETWSGKEVLRDKDFEQMTADELKQARDMIQRMTLILEEIRTRRYAPAPRGRRLDPRRILRDMSSRGPDYLMPRFKERTTKRPTLVILCDISGSMDSYARVILHFLYAITNERDRVHTFLFGTRLTNVTRALKNKDPDIAIAKVCNDVVDWSGGTRIGQALVDFNRYWARRVLGQNATVLLFTDGLDRERGDGLDQAARRLRASCRRFIWLNPLMRFDKYSPVVAGARILARHVNDIRACHNLASLQDLAEVLSANGGSSADVPAKAGMVRTFEGSNHGIR